MSKNRKRLHTISLLGLFLALAILLNYVENFIPVLIPVPGVRLGLANTMGLILLFFFGKAEYGLIGFFRVLIVSLLFSGLFSAGFFLSLSGWFLSCIGCILLSYCKKLSIYSLSVASAILHGIGQILCACILYSSIYMLTYLPILLISGLITGIVIAKLSSLIIIRIAPYIKKENLYFFFQTHKSTEKNNRNYEE